MRRLLFGSILIAGSILAVPPSTAMSEADCQALWKKADANGDGILTGQEAKPFMAAMAEADSNTMGETLELAEFLNSCQAGDFDQMNM